MITLKINPKKIELGITIIIIPIFAFYSIIGFHNITTMTSYGWNPCVNDVFTGIQYCGSHASFFIIGFALSILMTCSGIFWLFAFFINPKYKLITLEIKSEQK